MSSAPNRGGQYGGGGGPQADGGDGLIVITYTPVQYITTGGVIGALACGAALAASVGLANVAAAGPVQASGLLSTQTQTTAAASSVIGPVSGGVALAQSQVAQAASAVGGVNATGALSASNAASGVGTVGRVQASGTLAVVNYNTLVGSGTVGSLQAFGSLASTLQAAGGSAVEVLAAGAYTQSVTAQASSIVGPVAVAGLLSTHLPVTLSVSASVGPLASTAGFSASQPLLCSGSVGAIRCVGTFAAVTPSVTPILARYYAPLDPRWFAASLDLRGFAAALQPRGFYILDNPDVTPTFETKDPRETVVLTFDAMDGLASGETLTSVASTSVSVLAGIDGSPNAVGGTPAINSAPLQLQTATGVVSIATGQGVQTVSTGGVSGCRYLIAITCNTSNPDKVLTLKGVLPVSST